MDPGGDHEASDASDNSSVCCTSDPLYGPGCGGNMEGDSDTDSSTLLDGGPAPDWNKIGDSEDIELVVDENTMESFKFTEEVLGVAKRWEKMAHEMNLNPKRFEHHLGMWLKKSGLFSHLLETLSVSDVQPKVDAAELVKFINTLLQVSHHRGSTHFFYDCVLKTLRRDAITVLEEPRFRQILGAIYPRCDRGDAGRGNWPGPGYWEYDWFGPPRSVTWSVAFQPDVNMSKVKTLMTEMASFACEACLTKHTMLALDNDLVRMNPSAMRKYGMQSEYDDLEYESARMDLCGSVGTGIIFSHMFHLGRTTLIKSVEDTLEPILAARADPRVQEVPAETEFTLGMNRAYSSIETLSAKLCEKGVHVLGKHAPKPSARDQDSVKVPGWGLIPVIQQLRLAMWATRGYEVGDKKVPATALTYAKGGGKSRVAVFYSTVESVTHRQWCYLPYSHSRHSHAEPHGNLARRSPASRSLGAEMSAAASPALHPLVTTMVDVAAEAGWPEAQLRKFLLSGGVEQAERDRAVALWRRAVARKQAQSTRRPYSELNEYERADLRCEALKGAEKRFFRLTQTQWSQDWLALRFGRVTPTGVVVLLAALRIERRLQRLREEQQVQHTNVGSLPKCVADIAEDLAQCVDKGDERTDAAMDAIFSQLRDGMRFSDALSATSVPNLRLIAGTFNLKVPPRAKKDQIVAVLMRLAGSADLVQTCLAVAALEPDADPKGGPVWAFNKERVLKLLPDWLMNNSKPRLQDGTTSKDPTITGAFEGSEYGLVHALDLPTHSTSIDGLLAFIPREQPQHLGADWRAKIPEHDLHSAGWDDETREAFVGARTAAVAHANRAAAALGDHVLVAAVEIKTRTTGDLLKRDLERAAVAKFEEVVLDPGSDEYPVALGAFKAAVFDRGHRHQLLQHTAMGVTDVFYVVLRYLPEEQQAMILRVVHVRFAPELVAKLATVVGFIGLREMRWVWDKRAPLPADERLTVGPAPLQLTPAHVKQMRALSLALVAKVKERGEPLPPARKIAPRMISLWNLLERVAGRYSEDVEKFEGKFSRAPPPMRFIIRLVYTCVLNAAKTYAICILADKRESWSTSPKALRRAMATHAAPRWCLGEMQYSYLAGALLATQQEPVEPIKEVQQTQSVVMLYKDEPWDPVGNAEHKKDLENAQNALDTCARSTMARFELFNTNEVLRSLRRSSYLCAKHTPVRRKTEDGKLCRANCWVCCRRGEASTTGRHEGTCVGRDTSDWCKECGFIPLCNQGRVAFGGLSCFDLFHHRALKDVFGGLPKDRFCANRLSNFTHGNPLGLGVIASPRSRVVAADTSPSLDRAMKLRAEALSNRKRKRRATSQQSGDSVQ